MLLERLYAEHRIRVLLRVICRKQSINSFNTIESKLTAMNKFLKLSASVQESFKAQLSGEKFATVKVSSGPPTDIDTLRFKFDMCRNTYTPQQQRDIEAIFEECRSLTSTNRTRATRRLSYILNINQGASQDSCNYF